MPLSVLKALIVVASPGGLEKYDLPPVDVQRELSCVQDNLGSIRSTALASNGSANLNNIITHLRDGYDILYVVCHGSTPKGDTWLWLEDHDGSVARISGADIAAHLNELQQRPRLTVLAACQSAGAGEEARTTDEGALAAHLCTTCQNRGEHTFWAGSQHDRRGLTCTTCHSNHRPESMSGRLIAKSQLEVCGRCHRDKLANLDRSGHMPVREGKMQCSTCHNMHGSQNVRLLRVGYSIGESCTCCHPEKRGPFLWEHPPVRENCATCHDPHGSANVRLLVAKQPFLCQRCHTHSRHPATIYDNAVFKSSNRVYGRGCVNCHSAIHGSVHPRGGWRSHVGG